MLEQNVRGDVLVMRTGQLMGRQLFELMRSEYLREWRTPLSSDVFSAFKQPNAKTDQAEVR